MKIRAEKELQFKDAAHIINHLNYLCRCDKAQRWTNGITKGNFVIYSENEENKGKILYFNKTPNELAAQAKKIKEKIDAIQDFPIKGRMLRIELLTNDKRFTQKDVDFGRKLFEAMVVAEEITPVCVVGHQDQEDCFLHWHMVYANNTNIDFGAILMHGRS